MFMYSYCYVCSGLAFVFHCVFLCMVLRKNILYYCHWVSNQVQLKIYHIIYHII